MSKKRTVYAVATGEYSDYGVEMLFEDRADAEATAARFGVDAFVQEFELYGPGSGNVHRPRRQVKVTAWVSDAGVIPDYLAVESYGVDSDVEPGPGYVHEASYLPQCQPGGRVHFDYRLGGGYAVVIWADDVTTGEKVAREQAAKVAAMLAEGHKPEAPYGVPTGTGSPSPDGQ